MRIGVTIIKVIVIFNLLLGAKMVFADISEKDIVQNHIKVGEKANAGDCTVAVRDVKQEGGKVRVDIAMTPHEIYGEILYKEYSPFEFYELTEETNHYGNEALQATMDEEFINVDNLMAEGESIYIPAGKTKVVSYLVEVPRNVETIRMDYSTFSGRTYYQLNFDIPIK